MIRRLLPHPAWSAMLAGLWLFLVNALSPGSVIFALLVGLVLPPLLGRWIPDGPAVRRPVGLAVYLGIVLWDILRANVVVAGLILFHRDADLRPALVSVPVQLESDVAISLLMGSITMTPGTVSCRLSADRRRLLVHCLHAPDPEAVVAEIGERYHDRLKEIFG